MGKKCVFIFPAFVWQLKRVRASFLLSVELSEYSKIWKDGGKKDRNDERRRKDRGNKRLQKRLDEKCKMGKEKKRKMACKLTELINNTLKEQMLAKKTSPKDLS